MIVGKFSGHFSNRNSDLLPLKYGALNALLRLIFLLLTFWAREGQLKVVYLSNMSPRIVSEN